MYKEYGIAIRLTDNRASFYTTEDKMNKLIEASEKIGKVYFYTELSIIAEKLSQLKFVVFFDSINELYYFAKIEKIETRNKIPFKPADCLYYGYDEDVPHKTWILLRKIKKINKELLDQFYIHGESIMDKNGDKLEKTLKEKINEPRFPRVYIYYKVQSPEERRGNLCVLV